MIQKFRFMWCSLFGAVFFGFCSAGFCLQFDEQNSCWLGAAEQSPIVTENSLQAAPLGTVNSLVLEFPGVQATAVQTSQGSFTRLSMPDIGTTTETGHPELPVYRRDIFLDAGGTYECQVTVLEEQVFSLRQLGLPVLPLPVHRAVPKVPGALEQVVLSLDPAVYAGSSASNIVRLSETGVVQDQKLFLLEIFPVMWDSDTGDLSLYSKIKVDVVRTDGVSLALKASVSSVSVSNRLLIVSADGLISGLDGFVNHKEAMGWAVDVVSASDAGASCEAIQGHICGRYIRDDMRPSHLLLVGDSDTIPVWTGLGPYAPDTDLYYACMDGESDWFPDMAYGRFPVRTSSQLSNLVQKVILYENSATTLSGFVSNAVFVASSDNYSVTETTHNTVINDHMDPRKYVSEKLYSYSFGAGGDDILVGLNAGCSLLAYSGHGYAYKWRDPEIDISDIYSLTNNGTLPLVASFACDTGSFATMDECFAEAWLRSGSSCGGVAVWSSSEDTYWDEDDILEQCLYDAVFTDGESCLGDIVYQAKQRYLAYYGDVDETRQYFEQYNLLGDPTMSLVVLDGESVADPVAAMRSLLDTSPAAGDMITVSIDLQVADPAPSALIISESLPSGWMVSNAMWNGCSMTPSYTGGEYKWLFGFGTSVSSGTLTYQTRVDGTAGMAYVLNGEVSYGSSTLVAVIGDQTISLNASIDSDGDGIPDDWELLYGLNSTNNADASENGDGDALNNYEEYLADTNPTNGTSCLYITDIHIQNGEAQVSWQGGQNAVQYFECSDDLTANAWQCLRIYPAPTAVTNAITLTNQAAAPSRYYRVRVAR